MRIRRKKQDDSRQRIFCFMDLTTARGSVDPPPDRLEVSPWGMDDGFALSPRYWEGCDLWREEVR